MPPVHTHTLFLEYKRYKNRDKFNNSYTSSYSLFFINFFSILLARSRLSTLGALKASTISDQLGDPFLNHASSIATKHSSTRPLWDLSMLCTYKNEKMKLVTIELAI